jgi:hypothetical protein
MVGDFIPPDLLLEILLPFLAFAARSFTTLL